MLFLRIVQKNRWRTLKELNQGIGIKMSKEIASKNNKMIISNGEKGAIF